MSDLTSWPLTEGPVLVDLEEGGALCRVRLNTPKANILDQEKIELLTRIFTRAGQERDVKAVLITAEGPHFSFGASVEEHLPGQYEAMIPAFHRLFAAMLTASVPTLAAVRGQCLGGALELTSFCQRVFAAPGAHFGQPEIVLGVIAPVASVALAERVGRSRAEDLCLSGRALTAEAAVAIGLIDQVAADPDAAAHGYFREHLLPHSASSLQLALRALRHRFTEQFQRDIAVVERLYTEDLMSTADAVEGLTAFVEKRQPTWSNK